MSDLPLPVLEPLKPVAVCGFCSNSVYADGRCQCAGIQPDSCPLRGPERWEPHSRLRERMMRTHDVDTLMDEHLRRMAEPEPYASLRRQKERIQDDMRRRFEAQNYDREAERLRDEIRRMGHEPCA